MFVPKDQNPALAAGLLVTATAFVAATTLLAKALGTDVLGPPLAATQISFGRFLFAFMALLVVSAVTRPRLRRPHLGLHAGRTLFGWAGVTLLFAAVAFIPMADATAISFMNPVFAMILAIPLLGERVGRVRWAAAAIAMTGALILLRPGPATFQPAALLALLAALMMGMEMMFLKKLAGREPTFQILLINNAMGLTLAGLATLAFWQAPNAAQWAALAGIGGIMACAQALYINALARADASFVAPFGYATLVFAALYDFVLFGVVPDAVSAIGTAVILCGALLLAMREGRARRAA